MANNYHVYVIELNKNVVDRPGWNTDEYGPSGNKLRCFYVGQSAHTPECRYAQHIADRSATFHCICGLTESPVNPYQIGGQTFVVNHHFALRPELYTRYNPLPSQAEAIAMEERLTLELRAKGWGAYSK
ncbi:MAG: hypothetical protein MK101_11945 [Phycisphaerales bacterium]|nr:hypothetical protein [Phycisphaerales bacterium]